MGMGWRKGKGYQLFNIPILSTWTPRLWSAQFIGFMDSPLTLISCQNILHVNWKILPFWHPFIGFAVWGYWPGLFNNELNNWPARIPMTRTVIDPPLRNSFDDVFNWFISRVEEKHHAFSPLAGFRLRLKLNAAGTAVTSYHYRTIIEYIKVIGVTCLIVWARMVNESDTTQCPLTSGQLGPWIGEYRH